MNFRVLAALRGRISQIKGIFRRGLIPETYAKFNSVQCLSEFCNFSHFNDKRQTDITF